VKRNSFIFLLLLLLLLSSGAFGQEILLRGDITNENEVEGIHILNTTSRYNTVANTAGGFVIHVKLLDTLVISSIHYVPEKIIVSEEIFNKKTISITLSAMVNELDEVVLGPNLSGNLATDLKNIKTEGAFNFDDVGIPGFKGKPEEKIVPAYTLMAPTAVNIEALYNHLSGYYKKLRKQRKWEAQNNSVAHMINYYTPKFFDEAYGIPENRLYDFLLYCLETTGLQDDFKRQNFAGVINIFEARSAEYAKRLSENTKKQATEKEE
jgi:hypothetical protein